MQKSIISQLFAVLLQLRQTDSMKSEPSKVVTVGGLVLVFFIGGLPTLRAEQNSNILVSNFALQVAPRSGSAVQAPAPAAAEPQSSASLTGTVQDTRGEAVPGVRVTLRQDDTVAGVVTADSKGGFAFADLKPGTYQVKVDATGIDPFASATVVLAAGEKRELPIVAQQIPTKITTVDVSATINEVAEEQVKEEEKQRILGFLPNFYTSYLWNAAPIKPKLKFNLALRTTTDPFTLLVVGGMAGVEQAHKTFPGYGQGSEGYAKRFGASYADTVSARMLGGAIFPVLFRQDPRYFYRGSGSIRSRIIYALVSTVICRGDNGQLQPNYSHVLGSFTAAGVSNLYRSSADRRASLTFRNGLIITGSGAVVNLMREFLSRQLTPNVPTFAQGKP